MKYAKREHADQAMAAWADCSNAPALAKVSDGTSYRVVEADADGVFIIRRDEQVIDVLWTRHSAGINEWTASNAYSIGCCYHRTYFKEQALRVPHGTVDLGPFLDQAVTDAHECESWRSFSKDGKTFIGAISEGEGVCPWMNGIPVPEPWSEQGKWPVVVFETVDGKFDKVVVARGQAHALVVNEDNEEIDRWSLLEREGRIDSSKSLAIESGDAIDLLHDILNEISRLDSDREAASYTDIWTLLNGIRERILKTVGEPLPF